MNPVGVGLVVLIFLGILLFHRRLGANMARHAKSTPLNLDRRGVEPNVRVYQLILAGFAVFMLVLISGAYAVDILS
jgi:hypothetical protein